MRGNTILETTERRLAYYGFVVTPDESETFAFNSLQPPIAEQRHQNDGAPSPQSSTSSPRQAILQQHPFHPPLSLRRLRVGRAESRAIRGVTVPDALRAMEGHVLAKGEVVGVYTLNREVAKTLGINF